MSSTRCCNPRPRTRTRTGGSASPKPTTPEEEGLTCTRSTRPRERVAVPRVRPPRDPAAVLRGPPGCRPRHGGAGHPDRRAVPNAPQCPSPARGTKTGIGAALAADALPGQVQERHLPAHGRRPVADGPVRLQAEDAGVLRQGPARVRNPHGPAAHHHDQRPGAVPDRAVEVQVRAVRPGQEWHHG